MKFATIRSPNPDGQLVLVSSDLTQVLDVTDIAPTLQYALSHWAECEPALQACYNALNKGGLAEAKASESVTFDAPLPRTWQWLDGSCFLSHGDLMQKAFNMDPVEGADTFPLVYQGAGDYFSGPTDPIHVSDAAHGADFEGEFAVITDNVPLGASAEVAASAIRLIVMLNDISYRALAPREMKTGFGFVQGKGATAFAPFAITPDELGDNWQNNRVLLSMLVHRNGEKFGEPFGGEMHFGFDQLIAHAALTRKLNAGTVIGSGTVSNYNPDVGQACISELRAKEMIANGEPSTAFLQHDEVVTLKAVDKAGTAVFGEIVQRVIVENSHV